MSEIADTAVERPVPLRAVVLLATAAFASSVNLRICDPLLPQIAHDFSATIGAAAMMVTAFTVGYGLLQLLFGPVGDRFGKYLVIALTSLATGAATAYAATAASLDGLIVARLAAGACAAAPIPLAFAWLGDAVPFERRQAVLARFLTAQISGIVLGQAAGGLLGDLYGWRTVLQMVGLLHVAAGLAMLAELAFAPGTQPPGSPHRRGLGAVIVAIADLLTRPWVRVVLISVAIEGFAFYGSLAYVGADLHHRLGLSFGAVGTMMAAMGAGAIVYAWTARYLLAWIGERGLVLGGGMLLALGYAALAATTMASIVPVIMAVLGLGFFMIHNTLQTSATQMAPDARGLGVSLFAFMLFIGQSLGTAIAAPVVDRLGAPAIFAAAAVILPAIALWFRKKLLSRPAH